MPITIDYSQFTTQTGNFPITPSQPYQYSGIYSGVNNLEKNNPIITFTNLPNGLRVATPESATSPFDTVFMDFDGINDYVLLSGGSTWYGTVEGNYIECAYTSGGFWAIAELIDTDLFVINTGAGNANSSILDIEFQEPNFESVSFTTPTNANIILKRGGSYVFNNGSGSFPNVFFHQETNDSWYPANIELSPSATSDLRIQGIPYTGGYVTTDIEATFNGSIEYTSGSLNQVNGPFDPPAPFNTNAYTNSFAIGYPWNSTVPNEIMSSYNIISDNVGNSGAAVIQLTNVEEFSELIPPLRKLHVLFSRA